MKPDLSLDALPLSQWSLIEAHGDDAGSFLQGQLTQDVVGMDPGMARLGGYCSAKGRLLATFLIVRVDAQRWWLLTDRSIAEALSKRLRMFILRAKCTLTLLSQADLRGVFSPSSLASSVPTAASDTGFGTVRWLEAGNAAAGLSIRWWAGREWLLRPEGRTTPDAIARGASPDAPASAPLDGPSDADHAWRLEDIRAGWPWITQETSDHFVPQMVNLELVGGVNFRKGCYPGQEVVARSQYRGILKRRMARLVGRFTGEAATGIPRPGTEIFHSDDPGQPAGEIVMAARSPVGVECLAEVKWNALSTGSLHLGSTEGPVFTAAPLPYEVPDPSRP